MTARLLQLAWRFSRNRASGIPGAVQGTILQEHWRSLEAFMPSYNHERPHQGYRLRGRTPVALFWGAGSRMTFVPYFGIVNVCTPFRVWTG
jgi:hypothetical protein